MSMSQAHPIVASTPPVDVEQMFRDHGPFVWRTLRRFGLSQSDADDLCQEVFLVVFKKHDAFEHRSSLETWLYGISIRVALAHRRRASNQREKPWASPPEVAAALRPDQELAAREAHYLLERAIDALGEDKRAVFVLHEVEQLSMSEVAERLGCPLQTAYSRLHAARSQLKSFLKKATRGKWHDDLPDEARMGVLALALQKKIAASAHASGGVLALKLCGILSSLAVAGAVWYATRTGPQPVLLMSPTPPVATFAAIPPAPSEKPSAIPTVSVEDLPRAAPSATPKPKAAPRESDMALLRRAQDALASNPARALALVREHEKAYPRSGFAQEREVLAIDALIRLGRRSQAEARADAFARAYPSSGHNRRIDSLLGR